MRIDRVKRLAYKPGDLFVVECGGRLFGEEAAIIHRSWRAEMPGTKLILLSNGNRLTRVLSQRHRKLGRMPAG